MRAEEVHVGERRRLLPLEPAAGFGPELGVARCVRETALDAALEEVVEAGIVVEDLVPALDRLHQERGPREALVVGGVEIVDPLREAVVRRDPRIAAQRRRRVAVVAQHLGQENLRFRDALGAEIRPVHRRVM